MAWSSSPTKVTLPLLPTSWAHQRQLLRVGVLGLVHDDVAEALPQGHADRRPFLKQANGLSHLVAVVDERALGRRSW